MISINFKKRLKNTKTLANKQGIYFFNNINNIKKFNVFVLANFRSVFFLCIANFSSILFFSLLLSSLYFIFDVNLSFAGDEIEEKVLEVATDDIYKLAETNGIANAICKAISMSTVLMVPLFAVMFTILGFKSFQGDMKWGAIATFVIGIAAFKGAGNILEMFLPNMGLQYGCDCAIERSVRDINGEVKRYATGVNRDCSEGTADYELEFGTPTL